MSIFSIKPRTSYGQAMSLRHQCGFALPMVLMLSTALIVMLGTMLFNSQSQKPTHDILFDQARASTIARGVMQLAIYKFRMLPAEFFRTDEIASDCPLNVPFFQSTWMADFDSKIATSPVTLLKNSFQGCQDLGVATFTRIVMSSPGQEYTKDVLRIVTFATVNQQTKTLEETFEIKLTDR
ncbi:MAG: hypothetical protein HQM09_10065 [Candidatus Riflebacteria bacterium]|nr:hypothetical protein [Candidatus Riflebacteria bacterium]